MPILLPSALLSGLALGAASILSLGPNSLMLIREGLTRGRTGLVATLVWTSYLLLFLLALVAAGRGELGAVPARAALSWFGCAVLGWFAAAAFRAAMGPPRASSDASQEAETHWACVGRVLWVVWSNPLTYLELFLIPTALCATYHTPLLRAEFIGGLFAMATLRCYGYSFGGRLCAAVLRHERALQCFDFASGLLLSLLALSLALRLAPSSFQ